MTNKEHRMLSGRPSGMQSCRIDDPKGALESFLGEKLKKEQ